MKKTAVLLLALVLSACAGTKAREYVLIPAMEVAWPPIAEAALREDPAAPVDLMAEALAARDRIALSRVDWPWLMLLAERDIARREAAGEIGPSAANLLRERILQFNESYFKAATR